MDVNQTKYHALLGKQDWEHCLEEEAGNGPRRRLRDLWEQSPPGHTGLYWNEERSELTLMPKLQVYPPPENDRPPTEQDRRGAARDRYGNWYWIDEPRQGIMIRSVGSRKVSVFWTSTRSLSSHADTPDTGSFGPVDKKPVHPLQLQGLTITDEHYLVVGVVTPPGFIVIDLHAGGAPVQYCWPTTVEFDPYDMAAITGGGFWILDRTNKRLWAIDRQFNVKRRIETPPDPTAHQPEFHHLDFEPVDPTQGPTCGSDQPITVKTSFGVEDAVSVNDAHEPVAIDSLEDGTVVLLDRDTPFSTIRRYGINGLLGTASLSSILEVMEPASPPRLTLVAYDFSVKPSTAVPDDGQRRRAQLLAVEEMGNQSYGFTLIYTSTELALIPQTAFFPMRLFSGKGLVSAGSEVFYDSGDRWIGLIEQRRPRYTVGAVLVTPEGRVNLAADHDEDLRKPLDGKEPDCVWHRLLIDACIPPAASIEVWSRAANRELDLRQVIWQKEPPIYRRSDGSELPFASVSQETYGGTWEVLLQQAKGRYLQLKLVLKGNRQVTPHLRALRVYYPRFSYLERYLPAVYRQDWQSARFLDRFLANVEGFYTVIEDGVAATHVLFDPQSVPDEYVEWLAGWYGWVFDARLKLSRQAKRLLTKHAMEFFRARGTIRGMQMALAVAMDECVDDSIFTMISQECETGNGARIVERFRTRKLPAVLLGDPTPLSGIREVSQAERWTPNEGAASLHNRYRRFLGQPNDVRIMFPIVDPGGSSSNRWQTFAQNTLGFIPSGSSDELGLWRSFLQARYGDIVRLDEAYGASYQAFSEVPFPVGSGEDELPHRDWLDFVQGTAALTQVETRRLWQGFLKRRYQRIEALNEAYRTTWQEISAIAYPSVLPQDGPPLRDWFHFEAVVLSMHRTAHRFTVMLPVPPRLEANPDELQRRRDLAERIIAIEKPAHTVADVKFFWSMFRVGEARLGCDTVLDLGSRAPEFMAPFVLGTRALLEGYLAPTPRERIRERRVVGDWYL
jgi:phage tail-like protein